ncbi:MAG: leucine-rich repeat protein [Roseburia sp.]|nr:leucine-rich repeat protein [Roseburia sp.]MCM1097345.1 leucine-rich repeat protein [Ruminococcus flavefaciens]
MKRKYRLYCVAALCLSIMSFCVACGKSEGAASGEAGVGAGNIALGDGEAVKSGDESLQAVTMRLVKTEGTVGVADDAGAEVFVVKDMGLYSGYGVATEAESYAWINLDDVKLTKMDAESKIGIRKEGRALEVLVEQGSLFFQVTEHLAEDESLTIRSSNTVVGIRGTCGWVSVDAAGSLELYLLEGEVEYTYQNPDTGMDEVITVAAGQKAALASNGDGTFRVDVVEFQPEEIPVFVSAEGIEGILSEGSETGADSAQGGSEPGVGEGSEQDNTGSGSTPNSAGATSMPEDHVMDWQDENLEAAMRDITGIAEGDILLSDVWELKTLPLGACGIRDVSALAELRSLENLFLSKNQISDVTPLSGLTNLTELDLGENQIGDVSGLSALIHLALLELDNNAITDVSPLGSLTGLTYLNLESNRISDTAGLASLENLQSLDLSGNQVDNLSGLSSLTRLDTLDLWGNQISDVTPLSGLTNLVTLELGENQIDDVTPLGGLSNLSSLTLNKNRISDVSALSGLTNLQMLVLSNNQISDVTSLSGLTSLRTLSLQENPVSDYSPVSSVENLYHN